MAAWPVVPWIMAVALESAMFSGKANQLHDVRCMMSHHDRYCFRAFESHMQSTCKHMELRLMTSRLLKAKATSHTLVMMVCTAFESIAEVCDIAQLLLQIATNPLRCNS